MDKERVVAILGFYRTLDEEIKLKAAEKQDIEDRYYTSISGINMDGMPKGKGGTSSPTETTALNVPEWACSSLRELEKECAALQRVKSAIRKELNRLPYVQRAVVMDFYIRGYQWVRISAQVHYSERQCKNIRDDALGKLAKRFDANRTISAYSFPQ